MTPVALAWKRTTVADRSALYAVAGEGPTIVLVHGWAMGYRSFRPAITRLAERGHRVLVPALPGFGGTGGLPGRDFSLAGYARWLDGFLDALGVEEVAALVGHSFGGAVAIRTAYDRTDKVSALLLVNAVGGAHWRGEGPDRLTLAERPLWHWGLSFPLDLLPVRATPRVVPGLLQDGLPNLIRNPWGAWKVADLARRLDLTAELAELRRRGLVIQAVRGRADRIVPQFAFEALCRAAGIEGIEADGTHSWHMAEPDAFVDLILATAAAGAGAPRPGGRRAAG